jgi:hypothetical protein
LFLNGSKFSAEVLHQIKQLPDQLVFLRVSELVEVGLVWHAALDSRLFAGGGAE